jgi:MtN3 and saliva related transmembrane protein
MDLAQTLGWTATILFSIMIIPQMAKTIRSRDTRGVSLFLFVIFLVANVIALMYAILIGEQPLVIKYIIAIETTLAYIAIFWYFRLEEKRNLRNR